MIAITGATGRLGRLVVGKLRVEVPADEIVGVVRSPEKASDLGIAARRADYDEPETLGPALAGVDTLLLISASEIGKRTAQHHNVIEAARRAGVKRIVYTSLLHAERSPLNLAGEHLATEAELRASGIPLTILRNGWYTENYTDAIPGALAVGELLGSAGDGKVASAARADYAEAAVVALTGAGHEGRTYELAGDEPWTLRDLAAEISLQADRPIAYRDLPAAEYAAALEGAGVPQPLARRIAEWDVCVAYAALFDGGRRLSRLIGRPTTPLAATVADALRSRSTGAAPAA